MHWVHLPLLPSLDSWLTADVLDEPYQRFWQPLGRQDVSALPTNLIRPAEQIWSFARILPQSLLLASGQDADTYQLWGYPIQYTMIQDVRSMPTGSGPRLLAHHACRPSARSKQTARLLKRCTPEEGIYVFFFCRLIFERSLVTRACQPHHVAGVLVTLVYKSNTCLSISVHNSNIRKLYSRNRLAVSQEESSSKLSKRRGNLM